MRKSVGKSALAWGLLIGTIPVGVIAWVAADFIELYLRSPPVIAATTVGFGLALWLANAQGPRVRSERTLTVGDCFLIGCAQALALIPGTSRSGITITAGLMLGTVLCWLFW